MFMKNLRSILYAACFILYMLALILLVTLPGCVAFLYLYQTGSALICLLGFIAGTAANVYGFWKAILSGAPIANQWTPVSRFIKVVIAYGLAVSGPTLLSMALYSSTLPGEGLTAVLYGAAGVYTLLIGHLLLRAGVVYCSSVGRVEQADSCNL